MFRGKPSGFPPPSRSSGESNARGIARKRSDGSQPELFVDNSDAENVVVSGDWKTEKNAWSAYGPDFLSDDSKGTFPKSLRYVPRLPAGNQNHGGILWMLSCCHGCNLP